MRGPFSMPRFNRGAHRPRRGPGVNTAPAKGQLADAVKDDLREITPGSWPA